MDAQELLFIPHILCFILWVEHSLVQGVPAL
jgi:hypothetical protein